MSATQRCKINEINNHTRRLTKIIAEKGVSIQYMEKIVKKPSRRQTRTPVEWHLLANAPNWLTRWQQQLCHQQHSLPPQLPLSREHHSHHYSLAFTVINAADWRLTVSHTSIDAMGGALGDACVKCEHRAEIKNRTYTYTITYIVACMCVNLYEYKWVCSRVGASIVGTAAGRERKCPVPAGLSNTIITSLFYYSYELTESSGGQVYALRRRKMKTAKFYIFL